VPNQAISNGVRSLRKIRGATAPLIAISEPTERSIPPVAITKVMPTATIMTVETWVTLSRNDCIERNRSVKIALKSRSAANAAIAPYALPATRSQDAAPDR
jgi:hypothetical protein